MYTEKEKIEKEDCYKAFVIYGIIGVVCIVNIFNVLENKKFSNELTKQIKLCKKMLNKREKYVEL